MKENSCDDEIVNNLQKALTKALGKDVKLEKLDIEHKDNTTSYTTYASTGTSNNYMYWGCSDAPVIDEKAFIPVKIIFSCPATICYFPDGTREVVKVTDDEEYVKEYGVMACIMKKIFKSRNQFKKLVKSGYETTDSIYERNAHNAMLRRHND